MIGFGAAAVAYAAAALIPVWLPLALGKRKKRHDSIHSLPS
jgi:hypothetical protein